MRRFTIGGCVYRMQVDARMTTSCTMLAVESVVSVLKRDTGPAFTGYSWHHTSFLPAGRLEWLNGLLAERDQHLAVTVDSDSEFDGKALHAELARVDETVAIGIVPFRMSAPGSSESHVPGWNIWIEGATTPCPNDEALRVVLAGDRRIQAGGFGVAVFNLDWFRQHWHAPNRTEIAMGIAMGADQDTALCFGVRRRGGSIIALDVATKHHSFRMEPR